MSVHIITRGPQLCATDTLAQPLLHAGTTALCKRYTFPAITACRDHSSVQEIHLPSHYCMQGPQLCARDSLAQPLLHAGTTGLCKRYTCPAITACRDHSSVQEIHLPSHYCMQGPQLCARDSLAQPLLHAGTTALCKRFTCPAITACRDHSSVHQIHLPPANYYCMQGPQLSAPDSLAPS